MTIVEISELFIKICEFWTTIAKTQRNFEKRVNLVDLVKSFQTSIWNLHEFTCKSWLRYSRERASQSLPKISQKLEKS